MLETMACQETLVCVVSQVFQVLKADPVQLEPRVMLVFLANLASRVALQIMVCLVLRVLSG